MMSTFKRLTDVELHRIFEKFIKGRHHVVCDKSHVHGFDCVHFDDETTMILERLRIEVIMLRDKLKGIETLIKK